MSAVAVAVDRRGRVRARYQAVLPVSRAAAWRTLRDFERIACLDHFHAAVDLGGRPPAPGIEFDLPHRIGPLVIARRGRILRWEEGSGYAFSDLARRAERAGEGAFPHVFCLGLDEPPAPAGAGCRLRLDVRGRWTTRWVPRPAARTWLAWNLGAMGVRVRNAILRGALAANQSSDSRM